MLDEPTIGLHPRDNQILLDALKTLSDKGNTLVVVEHDEDTIRRADHIIDIGPGAGKRGGRLVAAGQRRPSWRRTPTRSPAASWRTRCGTRCSRAGRAASSRRGGTPTPASLLTVHGATLHNLQQRRPSTCRWSAWSPSPASVGSGKSTLARDVLLANVQACVQQRAPRPAASLDAGEPPRWTGCDG